MKLVVLDPVYLSGSHISRLGKIGEVVSFNTLPKNKHEILHRILDANIIITSSVDIGVDIIGQCKSLKMICLACTGVNRIDIRACNKLGIVLTNVASYATEAVAEHAFGLLLTLMKRIKEGDQRVRDGRFSREDLQLSQLSGKVFGIIGTGRIGSRVAKIANSFNCRVIATTLHPSIERGEKLGIKYVKLTTLLKESDIISLHVPLDPSTVNLISHGEFLLMKKRPILINTSRGKVINYNALLRALTKGMISGAGLDVLPYEPPYKDDPLLKCPHVIFSPHNAFCTPESLKCCADAVIANIESFVNSAEKN